MKISSKLSLFVVVSILLVSVTTIENDIPYISPIQKSDNPVIKASFGKRIHPIYWSEKMHLGVDIMAKPDANVFATANGKVIEISKSEKGYGNSILIRHNDSLKTRYAHLNEIFIIEGQNIIQNQEIATVGNTGTSTEPHLHYEVLVNDNNVDPEKYFSLK